METEPAYRWVIVIASAVMLAIGMGVMVNGISAYFIPLNEEFGWQRGSVSLINFSGLIGSALLIGAMGWRNSLTAMGVIALAVLIPLALLIRQPPARSVATSPGGAAMEDDQPIPLPPTVVVAWLSAAVVFCCICMSVPLMHLLPLIQDRGIALEDAGSVVFLMMTVAIFGRIAFGKLADMIGALRAYMIASLWQTVLVFVFIRLETLDAFYIFVVIYGFGYAGVMTTILVSVRVLTPLGKRAAALGIVTLFGWVGHAIGGSQGGYFFDLSGDYTLSYANAALAGVVNLIIVGSLYITITRRKRLLAYAG